MNAKHFLSSKTFWFGALYVVIGAAGIFGFADWKPSTELEQLVLLGTGLLAIVLRFLTKQPIGL